MHLRAQSVDRGVQSFVWAVVFFLYMFLGGLLIGVDGAPALVLSLVASFFIFLFVRTRGVDDTKPIGSGR